jgi:hypothetical protein
MAEESVRVANDGVAQALQAVKDANDAVTHALQVVKNGEEDVKEWNIRIKSDLSNQDLLRERKEANERLDKANERLDKANERLDKARAELKEREVVLLQLTQLHQFGSRSIIAPAYISQPSQASSTTVGGSFWHSNPINHRTAFDALTMMEVKEVESTCFGRCAKEILETLSKANRHEDLAGIFYDQSKPHGEISMTAMLTEVVARTLNSSEHGLRWYHQLQDPAGGVVDVALYAVREKGYAQGLQIPCAIFEAGLNQSRDSKRWQTFAYLINQSHLLDTPSQALLSVELILNFNHRHSLSLRCATVTGQRALWNSTIWRGDVTETTLARVLFVLVENAKRNAQTDEVDWQVLGPNCALDLKTKKVYKCFDYRYREDPAYKRSATYYMKYLNAQPVVEFDKLLVITYDYVSGSHVANNTSDFVPLLKMLGSLHANRVVHGDIRLSNIVFAGMQSSLIDFDFSGEHGIKQYPPGFNRDIFDGSRHENAKENAFLELEHDLYAMSRLMNLFATTESSESWYEVREAVSNGEIEKAIQMLNQLRTPVRCVNSAIMDRMCATGSPKKEQSKKKSSKRSHSSKTRQS